MRIEKLNQTTKKNLLEDLLKRSPNSYEMYEEQVKAILDNVKKRGDEALFEYTEKFDGFCLDQQSVLVKEEEIEEAYTQVDRGLIEIIRKALKNIETYHEKQRQYSWFDSKPDGTMRKLTDPSKLHALGWHHKIEIEEGVRKMYEWYLK